MKTVFVAATSLICAALLSSCSSRTAAVETSLSGPPKAGTLYSLSDGEGGFRAAKVIAVEEEVIFTHFYSQRWTARPTVTDAQKTDRPASVAFSSQTFAGMQPMQVASGSVSAEEQEAYESWKQSKQDIF